MDFKKQLEMKLGKKPSIKAASGDDVDGGAMRCDDPNQSPSGEAPISLSKSSSKDKENSANVLDNSAALRRAELAKQRARKVKVTSVCGGVPDQTDFKHAFRTFSNIEEKSEEFVESPPPPTKEPKKPSKGLFGLGSSIGLLGLKKGLKKTKGSTIFYASASDENQATMESNEDVSPTTPTTPITPTSKDTPKLFPKPRKHSFPKFMRKLSRDHGDSRKAEVKESSKKSEEEAKSSLDNIDSVKQSNEGESLPSNVKKTSEEFQDDVFEKSEDISIQKNSDEIKDEESILLPTMSLIERKISIEEEDKCEKISNEESSIAKVCSEESKDTDSASDSENSTKHKLADEQEDVENDDKEFSLPKSLPDSLKGDVIEFTDDRSSTQKNISRELKDEDLEQLNLISLEILENNDHEDEPKELLPEQSSHTQNNLTLNEDKFAETEHNLDDIRPTSHISKEICRESNLDKTSVPDEAHSLIQTESTLIQNHFKDDNVADDEEVLEADDIACQTKEDLSSVCQETCETNEPVADISHVTEDEFARHSVSNEVVLETNQSTLNSDVSKEITGESEPIEKDKDNIIKEDFVLDLPNLDTLPVIESKTKRSSKLDEKLNSDNERVLSLVENEETDKSIANKLPVEETEVPELAPNRSESIYPNLKNLNDIVDANCTTEKSKRHSSKKSTSDHENTNKTEDPEENAMTSINRKRESSPPVESKFKTDARLSATKFQPSEITKE